MEKPIKIRPPCISEYWKRTVLEFLVNSYFYTVYSISVLFQIKLIVGFPDDPCFSLCLTDYY